MKRFVIRNTAGSFIIEVATNREAARIARKEGRNLMKYNGERSVYWVWDEAEKNILYMVTTVKVGRKIVTSITNMQK